MSYDQSKNPQGGYIYNEEIYEKIVRLAKEGRDAISIANQVGYHPDRVRPIIAAVKNRAV